MSNDLDRAVEAYVRLRDELDGHRKTFKDQEKAYKEKLDQLADFIGRELTDGVESIKTSHGTAFWATKDFVSVQDAEAFFNFILETGDTQLLNKSANKTAAKEYMDEHNGIAPPGLEYSTSREIQIRRPRK